MANGPGCRKVTDDTIVPSRIGEVSRASPASTAQASVGPGPGVTGADPLVVVGPEERVEAEPLGLGRDPVQVVVGRALLGLGHDP